MHTCTFQCFGVLVQFCIALCLEQVCFQGWIYHNEKCYKVFKEQRNWREAREECRLVLDGDLANFKGAGEQREIVTKIINDPTDSYWIGLQGNGSSWTWTSGEDISSFSSFRSGTSKLEDFVTSSTICVAINSSYWQKYPCSTLKNYICQSDTVGCNEERGWRKTTSHHCIKISNVTLSYTKSQGVCRENGADLAVFKTMEELNNVVSNLSLPHHNYWVTFDTQSKRGPSQCDVITVNSSKVKPNRKSCSSAEHFICELCHCASTFDAFDCGENTCVSKNVVCDGNTDCQNEADEGKELCENISTMIDSTSTKHMTTTENILTTMSEVTSKKSHSLQKQHMTTEDGNLSTRYDYRSRNSKDDLVEHYDQCIALAIKKRQLCLSNVVRSHVDRIFVQRRVPHTEAEKTIQMYLDLFNAFLGMNVVDGKYADVETILNISSVLQKLYTSQSAQERCNGKHLGSYVERRQNIELHTWSTPWKENTTVWDGVIQRNRLTVLGLNQLTNKVQRKENDNITIILILIDDNVKEVRDLWNKSTEELVRISPVMSISGNQGVLDLSLRHIFFLEHYDAFSSRHDIFFDNKSIKCGYIDDRTRSWSFSGCEILWTSRNQTSCYCNHTTNFAILMQIKDFEIKSNHRLALNIITYVGCSISLITQLMAVTVFTCVGSLNSERIFVHRNLCLAIIAAQLAFLSGIKAIQIKIVCSIVAIILHYFYNAVFVWMLVEGLLLYVKVVQVFGTEKSRFAYFCVFGWGLPFVLVVISAVANWKGYGTETSCWLSTKDGTIWAFVGPAVAIIFVNVVVLWMVIRVIMNLEKNNYSHQLRSGVKGAIFLLPLLGLTWLFGLMAVNEELIVFQYIFAALNSLQGFFIFLFHCVCNSEVRQALQRMREKRILSGGDFVTTCDSGTYSEASLKPNKIQLSNIKRNRVFIKRQITSSTRIHSGGSTHSMNDLKVEDVYREGNDNELMFI